MPFGMVRLDRLLDRSMAPLEVAVTDGAVELEHAVLDVLEDLEVQGPLVRDRHRERAALGAILHLVAGDVIAGLPERGRGEGCRTEQRDELKSHPVHDTATRLAGAVGAPPDAASQCSHHEAAGFGWPWLPRARANAGVPGGWSWGRTPARRRWR